MLWAVFQAYEHEDFRYIDFIKEKVKLIIDIFDFKNSPYGTYYSKKNAISLEKISPQKD